MENWSVPLLVFGAVAMGMLGQGWMSLMELRRRGQVLDVIKAAYQAGKEPPPELYAQIRNDMRQKKPWTEVVLFGALAVGFWVAFFIIDSDRRAAFLIVAVTMTATSIGCLVLALTSKSRSSLPPTDVGQ